jgi:hypothetical protein
MAIGLGKEFSTAELARIGRTTFIAQRSGRALRNFPRWADTNIIRAVVWPCTTLNCGRVKGEGRGFK